MIFVNIIISNPFSNKFKILFAKHGNLSKYKAWEFNGYRTNTLFTFEFHLNFKCDHAGVKFQVGSLGYEVELNCYDSRHWDNDNDSWVDYDRSTI